MKIYYIGQLWQGGTCLERKKTLERLGCSIIPFDTTEWNHTKPRLLNTIAHRLNIGPQITNLNRSLVERSKQIGPVDLIWVDKGKWLWPDTLRSIRQATSGYLLHYTPDSHFFDNRSWVFNKSIHIYDCLITTKLFEVEQYKRLGASRLITTIQGFDPRFAEHKNFSPSDEFHSDICFVGHYQPHYAELIRAALEITSRVAVWGPNWPEFAKHNGWAKPIVKGEGAWGDDYLKVLAGAKIGLGLLGKHIPEVSTTRSFEIPATGLFMLAERSSEHSALFAEDKEAVFFSDKDELKKKISYYLSNPHLRQQIASAGKRRCLASGYSGVECMKTILSEIGASRAYQLSRNTEGTPQTPVVVSTVE